MGAVKRTHPAARMKQLDLKWEKRNRLMIKAINIISEWLGKDCCKNYKKAEDII